MKKRFLFIFIVLGIILTVVLSACSAQENSESKDEENASKKIKVGLLLPDTINDQGWNAIAYKGLKLIEENYGAEVSYIERVSQSDMEEQFRNYALQEYDVVFGHGFQYGDTAMKVAKEFPKTKFIITSTNISQEPNVASVNENNFQKGFLPGVIAALVSKNDKVGAIGGRELPPVTRAVAGFEAGAKYINPKIEVFTAITGDNEDGAKSKEVALAMIGKGADVLMPVSGAAAIAVVQAAKEKGILAVGTNGDMNDLAPDTVVTSCLANLSEAMNQVVGLVIDGKFQAISYDMGIKEGIVKLTPYHSFEKTLDPSVIEKVNSIIKDIENDVLDTNTLTKKDTP